MSNIRQFPKKEEDKKEQQNKRMHGIHKQAMREMQAILDKYNIDCVQVFMHTIDTATDVNAFDAQIMHDNKLKGGFMAAVSHQATMLYMSYMAIDQAINSCPFGADIREKIEESKKEKEDI